MAEKVDFGKNVLKDKLLQSGAGLVRHPFLMQMRDGALPLEKWRDYIVNRLSAGGAFVEYLSIIEQSAKEAHLDELALAVANNIDDEMGNGKGKEYTHDEWRNWCRDGMKNLFQQRGIEMISDQSSANEIYQRGLSELEQTKDPIILAGSLAALEYMIALEYTEVLAGVTKEFPSLETDSRTMMYWRSHAFHDVGHFIDIYEPLSAACTTPLDIENALRGNDIIFRTKMSFFDALDS